MTSRGINDSYRWFPRYLLYTDNVKLTEFLMRVKRNILKNHINAAFAENGLIGYTVTCKVNHASSRDIYVAINIFIDKIQHGHITFHLMRATYRNNSNGPMHIANNVLLRRSRITVTRSSNLIHGVRLSKGPNVVPSLPLREPVVNASTIILDVINKYCNPNSTLSLNNKIFNTADSDIEEYVTHLRNSHGSGFRGGQNITRKRKYTCQSTPYRPNTSCTLKTF